VLHPRGHAEVGGDSARRWTAASEWAERLARASPGLGRAASAARRPRSGFGALMLGLGQGVESLGRGGPRRRPARPAGVLRASSVRARPWRGAARRRALARASASWSDRLAAAAERRVQSSCSRSGSPAAGRAVALADLQVVGRAGLGGGLARRAGGGAGGGQARAQLAGASSVPTSAMIAASWPRARRTRPRSGRSGRRARRRAGPFRAASRSRRSRALRAWAAFCSSAGGSRRAARRASSARRPLGGGAAAWRAAVALGVQLLDLGLDLGQAGLLLQAHGRGLGRVGAGHEAVPAPEVAFLRDQPAAGRQRLGSRSPSPRSTRAT
jgi:hypothetical protein